MTVKDLYFIGETLQIESVYTKQKYMLNLVEFRLLNSSFEVTSHPEHEEMRWVSPYKVESLDLLPNNWRIAYNIIANHFFV